MTNHNQQPNPVHESSEAQSVWHDDEIDKLSTVSARTVAAVRAVDAEDATVQFDEPLAAWLAGDDWLTSEENRALFRRLPAPPGSQALVTCIPAATKTMVNDPAVQERLPRYRALAPAWKTDLDEFRETVGAGWTIAKEVNLFDYAEQNGRALAQDKDVTLDHRDVAERYLVMRSA